MTVQKSTILEKFEDTGLTSKMTAELYELIDICSQYNLSSSHYTLSNSHYTLNSSQDTLISSQYTLNSDQFTLKMLVEMKKDGKHRRSVEIESHVISAT